MQIAKENSWPRPAPNFFRPGEISPHLAYDGYPLVVLYKNTNCQLDTFQNETLTLKNSVPFHKELVLWKFNPIRSISHCNHFCPVKNNSIWNPREGELLFFIETDFKGNFTSINATNVYCKNIENDLIKIPGSIKVSKNSCAIIFSQLDCLGDSFVVTSPIPDSSVWRMTYPVKSVQQCFKGKHNSTISVNTTMRVNRILTATPLPKESSAELSQIEISSTTQILLFAVSGVVGVIIMALVLLAVRRKCHAYQREPARLSEREIQEFFNGFDTNIRGTNSDIARNPDENSTERLAQNRAYNKKYDVPSSGIEYDLEEPLIKEDLGVIYKGILKTSTEMYGNSTGVIERQVTIKTANPSSGLHGLRSLLKEVKVMLYLGKHANIAHLVGCCTENLNQGKMFLLMEFCAGGTLYSYLQTNRQSYKNLVTKGRLSVDCDMKSRVTSIQLPNMTAELREQSSFDTFSMVQWCIDVSSGMEFLSNAKIVHSDLAAKNILLTDKMQAKISDYGLSRQIFSRARYLKTQHEPWRWMALESLRRLEFSSKSDVWSYGILCWEIFTLGEKPYHGVRLKEQFVYNLEEGLRLTKPRNSTNEFYNLMLRCWEDEPQDRPSFTEISNQIQEMLEALINWMN